jgi:hypothetical protein
VSFTPALRRPLAARLSEIAYLLVNIVKVRCKLLSSLLKKETQESDVRHVKMRVAL